MESSSEAVDRSVRKKSITGLILAHFCVFYFGSECLILDRQMVLRTSFYWHLIAGLTCAPKKLACANELAAK